MGKQQYGIKNPKTGKTLTVSRDVYAALQAAQEMAASQQGDMGKKLESIGKTLTKKQYLGSSKDIDIAVKFDEKGKVDPTVELKNSLEHLDDRMRRIVEDTIYQFTLCLNQTLEDKSKDMEKELREHIKPAA